MSEEMKIVDKISGGKGKVKAKAQKIVDNIVK